MSTPAVFCQINNQIVKRSYRREQAVAEHYLLTRKNLLTRKREPEMKVRLRTRQQLATELARAAWPENPDSPASRVRIARELLGDGYGEAVK